MLKKVLLFVLIFSSLSIATVQHIPATPKAFKGLKVIDIRTPAEWKETGIIQGSYTLMFFDEKGKYDIMKFIKNLDSIVKKGEKFALVCRTGSRTNMVSEFLAKDLGYNVVDLQGGLVKLVKEGYKTSAYMPKR